MIAKLSSGKPGWTVKPRAYVDDPQKREELKVASELNEIKLRYDYENPDFDEAMQTKLSEVLTDAVVTGTGVAKVPWCMKTKRVLSRVGEGKVKTTSYRVGLNDLVPVSVFRTFVSPVAKSLQSAPWIIVQEWTTLADLKSKNEAYGGKYFKNLEEIESNDNSDSDQYQYEKSRNQLFNSADPVSLDDTITNIEVWECYDRLKNKLLWIANGKVLIREETNPYWHGKLPLVKFEIKPRPQQFWGQGIFEVNERMQLAANDIFNQYIDNMNLALDGGVMVNASSELEDFYVEPGFVATYQGAEPPTPWKFPEPNPNGVKIALDLFQGTIQDNSISPYSAGTPSSENDQTQGTMGGIQLLQQAADDVLGFMRQMFLRGIHEVGRQWMSNNQQFMDRALWLEITKSGVQDMVEIAPESIQGEFDLVLDDASMAPISKEQEAAQYDQWLEQMKMLEAEDAQMAMQNPDPMTGMPKPSLKLDRGEIAREISEKKGIKGFERFIISTDDQLAEQQEMMMAQEQQMMAEQQAQEEEMMMQEEAQSQLQQAEQEAENMKLESEVGSMEREVDDELEEYDLTDPRILDKILQ